MKKLMLILSVLMFSLFVSCEEDCDCIDSSDDAIVGMWERTVTDNEGLTFGVYLLFEEDGDYAFLLAEPAEGHTNSYADYRTEGKILTIYNDSDCPDDGLYEFSISGEQLTLEATEETCTPRQLMLEGTWIRNIKAD